MTIFFHFCICVYCFFYAICWVGIFFIVCFSIVQAEKDYILYTIGFFCALGLIYLVLGPYILKNNMYYCSLGLCISSFIASINYIWYLKKTPSLSQQVLPIKKQVPLFFSCFSFYTLCRKFNIILAKLDFLDKLYYGFYLYSLTLYCWASCHPKSIWLICLVGLLLKPTMITHTVLPFLCLGIYLIYLTNNIHWRNQISNLLGFNFVSLLPFYYQVQVILTRLFFFVDYLFNLWEFFLLYKKRSF